MASESPPPRALDEKHVAEVEESKHPSTVLSDEERRIIDLQLQAPQRKIGYFSLLRYANKTEKLVMVVSVSLHCPKK
jgi:ATP-binding cassette subfamily B (MDR/TAP) protein 1